MEAGPLRRSYITVLQTAGHRVYLKAALHISSRSSNTRPYRRQRTRLKQ